MAEHDREAAEEKKTDSGFQGQIPGHHRLTATETRN